MSIKKEANEQNKAYKKKSRKSLSLSSLSEVSSNFHHDQDIRMDGFL